MSKATIYRKSNLKKQQDRNSSINDQLSDDETNQRRVCYPSVDKEKQQRILTTNHIRKNQNQLSILSEILSDKQNINELKQKYNRSERSIPKNNIVCNGKHRNSRIQFSNDAGIKTELPSSNFANWNRSEEGLNKYIIYTDNLSMNSADEEVVDDRRLRVSRSDRKYDQQHSMIRSKSLHSQSTNKIPIMSHTEKSHDTDSHLQTSSDQLKRLLDYLSSELNDLESITGFKPNKIGLSSNTCSSTLATALIILTGHIKQYTSYSKDKQEINNLKDQLSLAIKTQLDFQKKIQNQITTLQTMMQTLCQLINNEIILNKKCEVCTSRVNRDQIDLDQGESRQNWLSNAHKPYITPKDTSNALDELLMFARRINNTTPIDTNHNHQLMNNSSTKHHSAYIEALEPSSSMSKNGSGIPRQRHNINQESRAIVTPMNIPSSYDIFESDLLIDNSSLNALRHEFGGLLGTSNIIPFSSKNETLLEKILQERLRLVQQMTELNKQHNMTQEELSNLEAKTRQSLVTNEKIIEKDNT